MSPIVDLTTVDLSLEVETDVNHDRKLKQIVADCSESHRNCPSSQARRFATAVLLDNNNSLTIQDDILTAAYSSGSTTWLKDSVLKFLKVSDQHLAFTSVLFKSKAFYLSYAPSLGERYYQQSTRSQQLPIIELPRTENGKPFVPPTCSFSDIDGHAYFPMSISHQYPFAGMARLVVPEECTQQPRVQSELVGLDIVVFDDFNPRLYESTLEFVCVFQDSFTEWEWEQGILKFESCGSKVLLQELYLRWSMKEAYTKAMGMGMLLEFSSFETHLHDLESVEQGLSPLVARAKDGIYLTGSISSRKAQGESFDDWEFFFKPLYSRGREGDAEQSELVACACVCMGPQSRIKSTPDTAVTTLIKTQTTSLENLLRWHHIPLL